MKKISQCILFLSIFLLSIQEKSLAQNRIVLKTPKDIYISSISLSGFVGGNYFYRHKTPLSLEQINGLNSSNINRFDRSATLHYSISAAKASDIFLYSSLALPAFLMIDKDIRKDASPIFVAYLQSTIITAAEIQFVKGLIDRARPFTYNPNAPVSEKLKADANASFFSGHTAMTACAASFTATVYTIYYPKSTALPYIYIAAAAIPITTGYLRYQAGKHFPSDIASGLIVGAINGFLLAKWHKE